MKLQQDYTSSNQTAFIINARFAAAVPHFWYAVTLTISLHFVKLLLS